MNTVSLSRILRWATDHNFKEDDLACFRHEWYHHFGKHNADDTPVSEDDREIEVSLFRDWCDPIKFPVDPHRWERCALHCGDNVRDISHGFLSSISSV